MKQGKRAARSKPENTRKILRKQKRQQKKQHRVEHYKLKKVNNQPGAGNNTPGRFVKRPAESSESTVEPKKKKAKIENPLDILCKECMKETKAAEKLKQQMEEQRKSMLIKANEEEDRIIKKLEKQLGLNKTKNKSKNFASDGLDYLLEICDKSTTEQIVAAEKHLAEFEGESDFEEDLATVTEKPSKSKSKPSKLEDDKSAKSKKLETITEEELGNVFSDDEVSHLSSDDDNEQMSDDEDDDEQMSDDDGEMPDDDDLISEDDDMSDDEEKLTVPQTASKALKANKDNKIKDTKSKKLKIVSEADLSNIFSEDEVSHLSSDDENISDDEEEPSISQKSNSKPMKRKHENKIEAVKSKKMKIVSEKDLGNVFSDDEVSHLSGDDDDDMSDDQENGEEEVKEKPDVWEDIYGRKRDKEGNVIKEEKGVYIPPHLRNKDTSSDEQLLQVKRQIKSVLNKLAGTNLHWASSSIEALYSRHSRHAVNSSLARLWQDACVGPSATPHRMLAEHAALLAVLHANVGSEIGAHFLQELSKRFDAMMQCPQPVEDKTLDNLVACLAYLYSFKIYHASLLYDILTRLLEVLSEKNIECVLLALRSVGGVLRKEEPLALKEFIHATQGRVAALTDASGDGSRIKFLLEVLMAVKNNNLTKIPNYDPSYAEELKKASKGIVRRGNYVTTLNIRLEDLLKADERGKWWVVGSAWDGNAPKPDTPSRANSAPVASQDTKLLELARKQRMNTDVRRSIFCVIMAAEDYMDAFEKLQHLGLRGQQEREVVHVLLACCLQERAYNRYYGVLAQKLCDTDRKYQLSIQFSVWDKIKELDSMSRSGAANLAHFLVHLFMEKGLPLSVLKVIQFSELNKHTVRFMRQILLAIIMNVDLQASLEVFHRVAKSPKLHTFRESIRLFIRHFLIKNVGKKTSVLSEQELETLKQRAVDVERLLSSHEAKLQF